MKREGKIISLNYVMILFSIIVFMFGYSVAEAAQPMVAAGEYHTVGLKADGTVMAVGHNQYGQCNVESWTNIVQVSAGGYHTVGLKSDGTVVAVGVGYQDYGQLDVGSWTNIVQVIAGAGHTVGLKADGTVVAVGLNSAGQCDVSLWENIIQLCDPIGGFTLGLKSDGTVIGSGHYVDTYPLDPASWTNIVQLTGGSAHFIGIKSDGSVIAGGRPYLGNEIYTWTDIIQVAAGYYHSVGLKPDGTLVVAGTNPFGCMDVSSWRDITQVAAGRWHTVGVKSDGSVVAVGHNDYGQCEVSDWELTDALLPEIELSLDSYNFGEVQWGQTSTAMVTITNVGSETLYISDISLNDDYGVFSIEFVFSLPFNLLPGESTDIGVTFGPVAVQSYVGSLVIESNDTDVPLINIPLSGAGVLADTPSEQVIAIINYIQDSISNGELVGEGSGNSADKKVNALINMIGAAGSLLEDGQPFDGCEQLSSIYHKVDGSSLPPDFVSGPATTGLADAIQDLLTFYDCGSQI